MIKYNIVISIIICCTTAGTCEHFFSKLQFVTIYTVAQKCYDKIRL